MSLAYKHIPETFPIPDWLRLEADAEKVVKQLTGLKEMTFYLRNPNAYIRRIALLHLGKLCLKDAPGVLTQILEDALETTENKKIAAWALNRVLKLHGVSWFLNHPLLSLYTGNEDAAIFGDVRLESTETEIRFLFTDHMDDMPDINDPAFLKTQMDEDALQIEFSLLTWLKESSGDIFRNLFKSLFLCLKYLLTQWIPKKGTALWKLLLGMTKRKAKKVHSDKHSPNVTSSDEPPALLMPVQSHPYHKRVRPRSRYRQDERKRKVRKLFQAVFYPFRLIKRHSLFTTVVLLCLYAFLSFTRYGNLFFYRLNPALATWNNRFVVDARADLINLFDIDITAANADKQTMPAVTEPIPTVTVPMQVTYQVIATKGLNLREEPRSDGTKIVFMSPKTIVTGIGETATDTQGEKWLKLVTQDGKTGWAAARWLNPIEEGTP